MKYYISLFQKIKEYYITQSNNPKELVLICPSLHIYEDSEMKLLLPDVLIDDSLKAESLLKKQDLSYQFNSIPSCEQFWDVNINNSLFRAYNDILNSDQSIQIADDNTDAQAWKILYDENNKPTKEKAKYDKFIKQIDTFLTELEKHVEKRPELQSDEEKQLWADKMNLLQLKQVKLNVDFKLLGFKKLIEDAENKVNKRDEYDSFLALLSDARNTLQVAMKTGITNLASYLDFYFVPFDFMSGSSGWIKLKIDKSELDNLYITAKANQNDFPPDLIDFDYDEEHIEGIELEFSVVTMQRNWLNLSPLESKYFTWKEDTVISDGNSIQPQYILPAFPQKMILIKNLKINIDPLIENSVIENLNSFINFGPIIMKNQLFTNATNNTKFIKAIKNKETILSKNLNYYKSKESVVEKPVVSLENTILKPSPAFLTRSSLAITSERQKVISSLTLEKPSTSIKSFALLHNYTLIKNLDIFNGDLTLATIEFRIKDQLSNLPIYKSELSIIGTNNSIFKEIETDNDGNIIVKLPVGNYALEIKKEGYSILKSQFNIENTNSLIKEYVLEPQSVSYDSYFLIGMVCEKLPKIPV